MSIPQLGIEQCCDTYYFVLELEAQRATINASSVKRAVATLLRYWVKQVSALPENDVVYLPFDFSDQYIGCLKVAASVSTVKVSYGISLIEGWSVNPLKPSDYAQRVGDFRPSSDQELELSPKTLLDAIGDQIRSLEEE